VDAYDGDKKIVRLYASSMFLDRFRETFRNAESRNRNVRLSETKSYECQRFIDTDGASNVRGHATRG